MSETTVTALTDWLLEQIAEDEGVARAKSPTFDEGEPWDAKDIHDRQWHTHECGWRTGEGLDSECSCDVPARVLATCRAHRAIVREHDVDPCVGTFGPEGAPCPTLRALASIYADRPGYDQHSKKRTA